MLRILKYAVSDEEWGLSGFLQFLKRALGEGRGVASLQCPSFTLSAVLKQHNRLLPLVQQGRGGGNTPGSWRFTLSEVQKPNDGTLKQTHHSQKPRHPASVRSGTRHGVLWGCIVATPEQTIHRLVVNSF